MNIHYAQYDCENAALEDLWFQAEKEQAGIQYMVEFDAYYQIMTFQDDEDPHESFQQWRDELNVPVWEALGFVTEGEMYGIAAGE